MNEMCVPPSKQWHLSPSMQLHPCLVVRRTCDRRLLCAFSFLNVTYNLTFVVEHDLVEGLPAEERVLGGCMPYVQEGMMYEKSGLVYCRECRMDSMICASAWQRNRWHQMLLVGP